MEAGEEGADAELELVVGGDAGQQRGQLDGVGELASVLIVRSGMLPRWAGWVGLVASVLYQGDILATAVPGFPVFDLAGFLGSTLWALWVIALGVVVLRRPVRRPTAAPTGDPRAAAAAEPTPGAVSA